MKGRTVLLVTIQIVLASVGMVAFFGGLFLFDVRVGVAGVGGAVALAALFMDDGTPP